MLLRGIFYSLFLNFYTNLYTFISSTAVLPTGYAILYYMLDAQ
jgi:hypothetical protein